MKNKQQTNKYTISKQWPNNNHRPPWQQSIQSDTSAWWHRQTRIVWHWPRYPWHSSCSRDLLQMRISYPYSITQLLSV